MKKYDLYELIRTLSSSEKKLFKEKYAGKEDGNFIRLFDVIASGKADCDEQVKKLFAAEKFVSHLHKTKAYLYEAILGLLYGQLQPHFVRLRILQKIEFVEVLFSRKLISQAEDVAMAALAEAQAYDELELEHYVRNQLNAINAILHRDFTPVNHEAEFREKMQDVLNRNKLFFEINRDYHTRGKKDSKDLSVYRKHTLLAPNQAFLSKRAEQNYETSMSLLNTVDRNYTAALENNLHLLNIRRKAPAISPSTEIGYINTLFNTILAMTSSGKDVNGLIAELEKFQPVTILGQSQKFVCLLRSKLSSYTSKPRSAEGKKLMSWIEKELSKHKNGLNEIERLKIYIGIAGLYMKEKEYNKALDYLPPINHSKTAQESRPVIGRVAILYLFIAHYELGNYELLGNTLRNYKYFQQTSGSFYLIEHKTLEFLKEAIRLASKKERDALKEQFAKNIRKAAEKENNSGIAYLENIDWLGR